MSNIALGQSASVETLNVSVPLITPGYLIAAGSQITPVDLNATNVGVVGILIGVGAVPYVKLLGVVIIPDTANDVTFNVGTINVPVKSIFVQNNLSTEAA